MWKSVLYCFFFRPASRFKCDICPKVYKQKHGLKVHYLRHKEPQFRCLKCHKAFRLLLHLNNHNKRFHDNDQKLYACSFCNYKGFAPLHLKIHVTRHHTKDFPLKCHICSAGFMFNHELKFHTEKEHNGMIYSCKICGRQCSTKNNLKIHQNVHATTRATFKCEICSKVMICKKGYQRHVQSHKGETPKQMCELCGKSFANKAYFAVHLKIHAGEREFACAVCGKRFYSAQNLATHNRTHTKEKPYTCDLCSKSYTQRSTLVIHMRSHSGEKPYKCDICCKAYVTNTLLKYHKCKGN